jgi:ribonuclease HII
MLANHYYEGKIEAGCDEAGRGCLAGPVYAAAVILPADFSNELLNDSKQLSERHRYQLREVIEREAVAWAVGVVSNEEIDRINILEADFLAMRRALQALGMPGINESAPEIPVEVKGSFAEVSGTAEFELFIAVDGNLKIRGVSAEMQMPIVKGDGRVASISAASILAKVFRDRFMDKLAETYPEYGFEKNAGYGSKAHLDAIRKFGFTPVHRRSFHPKGLE